MPKLTQSVVKSLTLAPGESQKFYMDDELTGFGVRVSPTKKVFYLQMRVGHKVMKRRLGEYGIKSVDQARKLALQMKAQLQSGVDPYAAKIKGVSMGFGSMQMTVVSFLSITLPMARKLPRYPVPASEKLSKRLTPPLGLYRTGDRRRQRIAPRRWSDGSS